MAPVGFGLSSASSPWLSYVVLLVQAHRQVSRANSHLQLAFAVLTSIRKGERIFHYLFTVALLAGAVAYFAMASDLAWTVISQADYVHRGNRQIFFAKYVFWALSFPVVIIALGLISAVAWASIFYNVTLAWVW